MHRKSPNLCDKCVFLRSAPPERAKEKKAGGGGVWGEALEGTELEGLEIEWTNRALSRYLWLNRAAAGSSSQQNAALGRLKEAQAAAQPP